MSRTNSKASVTNNTVVVAHTFTARPSPATTPDTPLAGSSRRDREPGSGSPRITTLPKTVGRSRDRFPNRRCRQLGSHKLWDREERGHRPRRFLLQSATGGGWAAPTRAMGGLSEVAELHEACQARDGDRRVGDGLIPGVAGGAEVLA